MDIKENLDSIFSHLENLFSSKTVIGEPITVGEVTLIPVVTVAFGMGTGSGEGKDEKNQGGSGAGVGTGAKISPNAIIVIRGTEVSMLPLTGRSSLENIVEMVPEVVGKLKDAVKK